MTFDIAFKSILLVLLTIIATALCNIATKTPQPFSAQQLDRAQFGTASSIVEDRHEKVPGAIIVIKESR